ncbi:sulfotransferase family 2 domain-containing protein [Flavobacteriaceae bacterium SZ-1-7]|uniref:sulfotransferase family 2 domain-containing protein n=1 Tax=Tamlana sedimenti TaxID=3134126 RepID=UPI003123718E
MVISKKHKFVFIHIPKNAGTSIQQALQSVKEKEKHWAESGKTKHQTFQELVKIYDESSWIQKQVKDFDFLTYFKFAVVRNPFERMVSLYNYLKKYEVRNEIKEIDNFQAFVDLLEEEDSWVSKLYSTKLQLNFVTDLNGKIAVDFIGRYEDLSAFQSKIEDTFGFKLNLKKLNVSNSSKPNYKGYYNTEIRRIVETKFLEDLNTFNYYF